MNNYETLCKEPSDINEHLPTLKDLAAECSHVTEMGVRSIVSTWAFLEGIKENGTLISIDYKEPIWYGGDLKPVIARAKERNVNFIFTLGDTREMTIGETELLFIDTNHTYHQLQRELKNHADKATKYIVLHDTTSCPEMRPAIDELLVQGKWKIKKEYTNNNGLMILEKC